MEREEKYNIKLNYYGEQIEITINSDYTAFISNLCNVLKISPERTKAIILSYNDEDGDNILLSNEEDYSIFIEQVKQKVVQELIIEVNDNLEDSDLNNKNRMEQSNINIDGSFNNISNSNMNISHNFNEEDKKLNEEFKTKNIPIENFVYYYKCISCSTYPIILIMYYCDKCNKYLCEKCYNKEKNHCHKMEKIINKFQLDEIKRLENETLEKKNEIKNKQKCNCNRCRNYNINNNYNNNYNYKNNYNNNHNLYYNNNYGNHINNNDKNNYNNNIKQYRNYDNHYDNYNYNSYNNYNNYNLNNYNNDYSCGNCNNYDNQNINRYKNNCLENKNDYYKRLLNYYKRKNNFEGISDQIIMEALYNFKGDFDKAIDYVSKNLNNLRNNN